MDQSNHLGKACILFPDHESAQIMNNIHTKKKKERVIKKIALIRGGKMMKQKNAVRVVCSKISQRRLMSCALSVVMVFALGGHVFAANNDALFIDEKGNVGIGTNEPKAALDVNGKVRAHELEVKGDINSAGTVKVKKLAGDGSALTVEGESIKLFLVPRGGIVAWYPGEQYREKRPDGTMKIKAPDGWAICDGENGTPDLTDRFIRGTINIGNLKKSGGTPKHYHSGITEKPSDTQRIHSGIGHEHKMPVTAHTHNFTTNKIENLPPYIWLVYIMKM